MKDDNKRAAFDQYGQASQQPGFDPNGFSGGGGAGFTGFDDFARAFGGGGGGRTRGGGNDLFEQLFNGFSGGGRQGPGSTTSGRTKGSDIGVNLNISFMEACKGGKRKVNTTPIVNCSPCKGSGLKPGMKKSTCTVCAGSGQRTYVIQTGFHMASTCNACSGSGSSVPKNGECSTCGGMGLVREQKTVDVDIPAGQSSLDAFFRRFS